MPDFRPARGPVALDRELPGQEDFTTARGEHGFAQVARRVDAVKLCSLDQPTSPKVPRVELQVIDCDDLNDEERVQLHAAIAEGLDDADAGRVISMEESIAEIRALRCGSK